VQGCSELVNELTETYNHIICAAGTGATAAGIISGIVNNKLNTLCHVVPVLKNGGFIGDEINNLLPTPANFQLHADYHFGGYGKTTDELIDFVKKFVADTGILIEPVYTGKMFYALYDLANKNYFKPGDKILAIHTGGLFGLLGMREKF